MYQFDICNNIASFDWFISCGEADSYNEIASRGGVASYGYVASCVQAASSCGIASSGEADSDGVATLSSEALKGEAASYDE